ncbi:MAG: Rpn family recombination-promoting nuclease/putative transposase [Bacteroidia bacterium]
MSDTPSSPPKSHDRFFKALFADPRRVQSFVRGVLPPVMLDILDFATLRAETTSRVDASLQEHVSDLTFRCDMVGGGDVYLLFLFEHKSSVPLFPHIQLLRYMLDRWEEQLRHEKALRPIIPFVLYHGKRTWHYRPFLDYLTGFDEALRPFVPSFDYHLTNLRDAPDEQIRRQFEDWTLQYGLLLMKHILGPDVLAFLAEFIDEARSRRPDDEQVSEVFRIFIRYTISIKRKQPAIMQRIEELLKTWPYEEGSIAHRWVLRGERRGKKMGLKIGIKKGEEIGIKKGEEKGMEKGMKQEKEAGIRRMLLRGFSHQDIAEIMEVPIGQVADIAQQMP